MDVVCWDTLSLFAEDPPTRRHAVQREMVFRSFLVSFSLSPVITVLKILTMTEAALRLLSGYARINLLLVHFILFMEREGENDGQITDRYIERGPAA